MPLEQRNQVIVGKVSHGDPQLSGVNYLVRSASIILAGDWTLLFVFGFSY
jgi:hypothetical protein